MLLALVNAVVALTAVGFLFYTKILFKRPAITEEGERVRLAAIHASPTPPPAPASILFDPTTVNIEANPAAPAPADGTASQLHGKLHYATVGFAIQIRDTGKKEEVEQLRPIIMDKFLGLLGRKGFRELTTVQGRYLLRTQMLDLVNRLIAKQESARENPDNPNPVPKDGLVTDVYFTQFIVQ